MFDPMETSVPYVHPKHAVSERVQEFTSSTLQSKLQFFTVKEQQKDGRIPEGLGGLPSDLTSVGTLTIEPEREREFSAERSKNGKREQSRKKRDCSRFFRD